MMTLPRRMSHLVYQRPPQTKPRPLLMIPVQRHLLRHLRLRRRRCLRHFLPLFLGYPRLAEGAAGVTPNPTPSLSATIRIISCKKKLTTNCLRFAAKRTKLSNLWRKIERRVESAGKIQKKYTFDAFKNQEVRNKEFLLFSMDDLARLDRSTVADHLDYI